MTPKMKEAFAILKVSSSADIQTSVAFSLLNRGLITVNGFAKGKSSHLNCSLKYEVLKDGVAAGSLQAPAETPSFFSN